MGEDKANVLIVGARFSGIGAICRLRRESPDKHIIILEARAVMGGTRNLFRYPGVRCTPTCTRSATATEWEVFGAPGDPEQHAKILIDPKSLATAPSPVKPAIGTAGQFRQLHDA